MKQFDSEKRSKTHPSLEVQGPKVASTPPHLPVNRAARSHRNSTKRYLDELSRDNQSVENPLDASQARPKQSRQVKRSTAPQRKPPSKRRDWTVAADPYGLPSFDDVFNPASKKQKIEKSADTGGLDTKPAKTSKVKKRPLVKTESGLAAANSQRSEQEFDFGLNSVSALELPSMKFGAAKKEDLEEPEQSTLAWLGGIVIGMPSWLVSMIFHLTLIILMALYCFDVALVQTDRMVVSVSEDGPNDVTINLED